ncbi:WD40-repeat-containing domain protein [Lasiosphaeria miniovina]|uniref:U three protein 7 n=1 Tax=Lasiosphaeria miniovina TaxID=1954250 RepID=A0AA40DMU6_9PEZI|nr:WD40-repeat-containing domain protein [Lasiosphaeria miniovina]KAK0708995.1 WD40-repeat-containing domain protein [Lasiosphaeria miniovina]
MEATDIADAPLARVEQPNANGALAVTGARTEFQSKTELAKARRTKHALRDYGRGRRIDVKGVKDKKLRRNLTNLETKFKTAALKAKEAEILLENTGGFIEAETELERTYRVRQHDIQSEVAIEAARGKFELKLPALGPYVCEYSRNGRDLLVAGRKGHIATMDWREGKLGCELQLGETIRDARWLHNNNYFVVAQKKYVYIYDSNGVELHCLKKHVEVSHMEFLPYHFLLATLGINGQLKYQDTSTGQLVTEIATKLGTPTSLAQNPYNAVLHVGHQNGTVTLWSPNSSEPLVKLLAHRGPVRSLAIDREGRYMVSAGQDNKMAVWDIRMLKEVNNYFTRSPASSVAISDTGLTAVGWGTRTTVWKGLFSKDRATQEKVQSPYMAWGGDGQAIERVRWCPFEDLLGLGHSEGFSSIIIPGAGEANFDALEVNPYETKKQRQEGEVKALLNKLKPEMIALDPNFIGNLDLRSEKQRQADKDLDTPVAGIAEELRHRARGKSGALKKYLRKQRKKNIIDETRLKAEEMMKALQDKNSEKHEEKKAELGPALARFARKD